MRSENDRMSCLYGKTKEHNMIHDERIKIEVWIMGLL